MNTDSMPSILSATSEDIAHSAFSHRLGRGFLWTAVFIASRLPEVLCRELGFNTCAWISPLYETFILLSLAIVAARVCSNKHFSGFILATAALTFGWRVVVPWIEDSLVFTSAVNHLSWGAQFFVLRVAQEQQPEEIGIQK